jgi:hypothetical protein
MLNKLTVTDSRNRSQVLYFGVDESKSIQPHWYDLPPLPPEGGFDARFETPGGGSKVQTHAVKASEGLEFRVAVQSDAYPLTIAWDVSKGTALYELTDGLGGRMFAPRELDGVGSIKITSNEVRVFSVKFVGEGILPKAFALRQNYPNPFNPSTTIKYHLPFDTRVTLKVFNIIGQEVATLVNEVQKVGYKSVTFDASSLASGTYFYRLEAGGFTSVKKLLLIK